MSEVDQSKIKGEPGTGYETGAKGLFQCQNCEYFRPGNNSCGQELMIALSLLPRTQDGRVLVDPKGCCEYVDRIGKK